MKRLLEPTRPAPADFRKGKQQPSFHMLQLGHSASTEAEQWQRVTVSSPGVFYPYRLDAATGAGALLFISIAYSPEHPIRSEAGFPEAAAFTGTPAGPGGSCYFTTDGDWWVRVRCGQAAPPGGHTHLPFVFLPYFGLERGLPPAFAWTVSTYSSLAGFTFGQSLAAGTSVLFVSVQELLSGVRGLEVSSNTLGTNTRYRSVAAPGGANHMPLLTPTRFAESFLPLSDLHILNNGAGNITIHKTFYR